MSGGKLALSLDDVIALTLENNLDIAVESYNIGMAKTDLLRAQGGGAVRGVSGAFQSSALFSGAIGGGIGSGSGGGGGAGGSGGGNGAVSIGGSGGFDPIAGFTYFWNQNTTPLGITVLQGVPVLTTHYAYYSYSLSQSFSTGTSLGIGLGGYRQTSSSVTTLYNPVVPTQLILGFTQPLLNGFGRQVNRRFIRMANNEQSFADSSLRLKVMTTLAKALALYWDVVSSRDQLDVAQKALDLARKTLDDRTKEEKLGVIAPFEVLRANSELARRKTDLVRARAQAQQQQEQLKTLLAKRVDSNVSQAEIVPLATLPEPRLDDIPPLEEALRRAAENRPEIEQNELNLRNQEITVKAARNALLPSLGVFGTYAPQGLSGNGLVRDSNGNVVATEAGGMWDALSQTFRNRYPDYTVGFSLSIPLKNRQAQADAARALLEERQLEAKFQQQKLAIEEEVRRAVIAVADAKTEIEAAQASVTMAQQTFDGEQKKFRLGESDMLHIIQAQRDLVDAETAEVTGRTDYAKALVQFLQATGTILDAYHVDVGKSNVPNSRTRVSGGFTATR